MCINYHCLLQNKPRKFCLRFKKQTRTSHQNKSVLYSPCIFQFHLKATFTFIENSKTKCLLSFELGKKTKSYLPVTVIHVSQFYRQHYTFLTFLSQIPQRIFNAEINEFSMLHYDIYQRNLNASMPLLQIRWRVTKYH